MAASLETPRSCEVPESYEVAIDRPGQPTLRYAFTSDIGVGLRRLIEAYIRSAPVALPAQLMIYCTDHEQATTGRTLGSGVVQTPS